MWKDWDAEATPERLKKEGIANADLLVLAGSSENPKGDELGPLYLETYHTGQRLENELRQVIEGSTFTAASRKIMLRTIREFGAARERHGRIGAMFELLSADEYHTAAKAEKSGTTKRAKGKRARRLKVLEELIVRKRWQDKSAYYLSNGYSNEVAAAIEDHNRAVVKAEQLTMVGSETLEDDLREVLKGIQSKKT